MITVKLYQFGKRVNSTKVPVDNQVPVQVFDGQIANATSLLTPTIIVNFDSLKTDNVAYNPLPWTYAFIVEMQRYYFITNWSWANGVYVANLSEDVLATYKNDILQQTLYVTRASAVYNGSIPDSFYPASATTEHACTVVASPFESSITSTKGTFVIGTVTGAVDSAAGVTYYAMPRTSFVQFMRNVFNSADWLNISSSEISQDLQKILFNPSQYLTSVMWFPFTLINGGENVVDAVSIGWWNIPVPTAIKLTGNLFQAGTLTIDIPKHPQTATRGTWVNLSPNTQLSLEFWPFGQLTLDTYKIALDAKLQLSYVVDYITGAANLRVIGGDGTTWHDDAVLCATGQIGVPIQIAQFQYNLSALGDIGTWIPVAAVGAASVAENLKGEVSGFGERIKYWYNNGSPGDIYGTDALAGLNQALQPSESLGTSLTIIGNDIYSAVSASIGSANVRGSNGSTAQLSLAVRVNAVFANLVPDNLELNGRPCCRTLKLETLTGFVKCSTGDTGISASLAEKTAIAGYLTDGFYIE